MNDAADTVSAFLSALSNRFSAAGIESPRLHAELLLSDALRCPRLELPLNAAVSLDAKSRDRVLSQAGRVCAHEPIQYVLGHTSFMGYRIRTDSRALIPRPETEVLVETALNTDALWAIESPLLADVGTGTGCIAIAICLMRPSARAIAGEASADAGAIGGENARAHGVDPRVQIRPSDLLLEVSEPLDAIVSNPPYVRSGDLAGLSATVREFEPAPALDAGPDGLDVIRRLIPQARDRLKPGGWLFLEIGETQAAAVRSELQAGGFAEIEVLLDLAGRDRIVRTRTPVSDTEQRN